MILRMIKKSFKIRKKRMILTIISVAMGALLVTSMLNIYLNIEQEMSKQLKAYGPNIVVTPKGDSLKMEVGGIPLKSSQANSYLKEEESVRIKKIFWKYNIGDFTPILNFSSNLDGKDVPIIGIYFDKKVEVTGESFKFIETGMKKLYPWLEIEGNWINDEDNNSVMIGKELAEKIGVAVGSKVTVPYNEKSYSFTVEGIIKGGTTEEGTLYMPIKIAQQIIGKPGAVSKIEVSSYITPDDDFAKQDTSAMTKEEFEKWYCTPYIDSIAYQIQEVITDSKATPVAQVASAQGKFLKRITVMIFFIAIIATIISTLSVMATMTAAVFERRKEIGVMSAIGADRRQVLLLFLSETFVCGLLGGAIGYGIGMAISYALSNFIFNVTFAFNLFILPVALISAITIAIIGSYIPLKTALKVNPVVVIRGE